MSSIPSVDANKVVDKSAAESDWLARSLAQPGASRWAEITGCRIHYLEWIGPPDAPTIVLIHGFRAHAHWWDFTAPLLAADFRVLALDLGGMGDSGHRAVYNHVTFAEEIAGVIAHAGARDAIVIGHSFGGVVSVGAAYRFPELIAHLILIDSRVRFADETHQIPAPPVHPKRLSSDRNALLERYRLIPDQGGIDPIIFRHIAEHSLHQFEGQWSWKFDSLFYASSLATAAQEEATLLQQLEIPVDYIYGEHSVIVSRKFAQRVRASVRNGCGPIEIPNAHHHVLLDQPLAMVAALRALLAK